MLWTKFLSAMSDRNGSLLMCYRSRVTGVGRHNRQLKACDCDNAHCTSCSTEHFKPVCPEVVPAALTCGTGDVLHYIYGVVLSWHKRGLCWYKQYIT